MKPILPALTLIVALSVSFSQSAFGETDPVRRETDRTKAQELMRQNNPKEAYDILLKLVMDPDNDILKVSDDFNSATNCLNRLNRYNELDGFREKAVSVHSKNWRLLRAVANSYMNDNQHYGIIVAGEFIRGNQRGSSDKFGSYERDRVRGLQLLIQAMNLIEPNENADDASSFFLSFADVLIGMRGYDNAWRLGYLTNIDELPDYDPLNPWYYGYGYGNGRGAPVDENGNPIFHQVPENWEQAKTDGERWRWCLKKAVDFKPSVLSVVKRKIADFSINQFGVQTMASYGRMLGRIGEDDDGKNNTSGRWELQSLEEDETIAKLASGVKRFKLPDDYNYIKIYGELNDYEKLGSIFSDRRQYPRSAEYWEKRVLQRDANKFEKYIKSGDYAFQDKKSHEWNQLCQIRGNWGMFETILTQPAGKGASIDFRFRNGKKVYLTAQAIDEKTLLEDVKKYLKSNPDQLDYSKYQISSLGYQILTDNYKKYIGQEVASWSLELDPRPAHWDRLITVATPLQKAGAYLLTAKMEKGNTTSVVVWISDTAIVKKNVNDQPWYFIADSVSGKPIAKANVEFFGFERKYSDSFLRKGYYVTTKNFSEYSDDNGQVMPEKTRLESNYNWLITATTDDGRFAYYGFTGVWYGNYYDYEYNQVKGFVMTDRPVYRPKQDVKFKAWVNHAKYDAEGKSSFAGQSFSIVISNPKGEKVYEGVHKADDYGGLDGQIKLADDATLGVYGINITLGNSYYGSGTFRVEEYKKPEFEVLVDAPQDPVQLGDKFKAKITAKYYFGAPVTDAKVNYKVLRSINESRWYPVFGWDWLYGSGYWWFCYDYPWYPGWYEWGYRCPRQEYWWYANWSPREQPEVVAEGEAMINTNGEYEIEIDSSLAKTLYGDKDHSYEISAEITDKSRRTITGSGKVLVSRKPFQVNVWLDRGYYRSGDTIQASFRAARLDGKPVPGKANVKLLKISYKNGKPIENVDTTWDIDINDEGMAQLQIKAAQAGQYRLSCDVSDSKGHLISGGYVFVIQGTGFKSNDFRFNDIEIIADKQEYKPGEKVKLMINTNRSGGTVLLFTRPTNGVYLKPEIIRLDGKSIVKEIDVVQKDMPNFFIEAITISDANVHTAVKMIAVPPEKRVFDVSVTPSNPEKRYKPGEKAKMKIQLTDPAGNPVQGSTVVTLYDKSLEYISGGSNVPDIKEFFWNWRRYHNPITEHSLMKRGSNVTIAGEIAMGFLGIFGYSVGNDEMPSEAEAMLPPAPECDMDAPACSMETPVSGGLKAMNGAPARRREQHDKKNDTNGDSSDNAQQNVQPTIRTKFADAAYWAANLITSIDGTAEIELTMPENLTTWKAKVWAMGDGTRVGQGECEIITTKNVIIRLQAPRFFVQKDEVVLSANVHNYLKTEKAIDVEIKLGGNTLALLDGYPAKQTINVAPGGEMRVDWRVKVISEGNANVTMSALTDEESDAMSMDFPVYVHGMLKTDSFCGVLRPDDASKSLEINVPVERRPKESRLEIRYSPTLAAACVDALPYLVEYPYGCTEQTLNKFLPTVITQKILINMGLNLDDIRTKRTNLNAQEIGDDIKRSADWKRLSGDYRWDGQSWVDRNPVFDRAEVDRMVKYGLDRLTGMQNNDGGWGWFSGYQEYSYPHTTAVVVHGLQIARDNGVAVVPSVIQRGVEWLKQYQAQELEKLRIGKMEPKDRPESAEWKQHADSMDALVYMILVDEKLDNKQMREYLYEDRAQLPVYALSMLGIACHKVEDIEKRDMIIRNISQYLVTDDENQTAYLNLPNSNYWWYWYGSEYEAHAYYLKLLSITNAKSDTASRIVKYLLNNRRHGTYWNSTRDTALCIEAFADYIKASGEDKPDMTVKILIDGKEVKTVKINSENIFSYDNKLVLTGDEVTSGKHTVEMVRTGKGPLYFNAYLTNFTMEDMITKAGLEIKVNRLYYKLKRVDKSVQSETSTGGATAMKVEKFERIPINNLDTLTSGDLVEIELVIESKNDYEYILFEDMKAAGFEPINVRSGYENNGMGAYVEYRDERVCFFVRRLARGVHSVTYRLRAEIPGKFSALPTKASAMYAPELRANSDEIKVQIIDAPAR